MKPGISNVSILRCTYELRACVARGWNVGSAEESVDEYSVVTLQNELSSVDQIDDSKTGLHSIAILPSAASKVDDDCMECK